MNTLWKWMVRGLLVLVVVLVVAISLTIGWRPFLGPRARVLTDRKFEVTPERLARGRYLANAVSGCIFCHSEHDWKAPGGPVIESKLGAGEVFPLMGLPGTVVAPNLTPEPATGAGSWSDDQLARAIREGIGHDGRTLFPLMPYEHFRGMSDEDVASVVVYLRSLPPVQNLLPKTEIAFPVNFLIRSVPQPVTEPVPASNSTDPVKRGEYLVQMAGCSDCHTPQERGQPKPGLDFAGGFELQGPFGTVTSSNITPDPSGISYYDENLFVQAMRTGRVGARSLNPIMPWLMFRNMTDEDLKAVFAYLRTLKPVHHRVDNTLPPTACRICGGKHGGGDQN
ncbi:MAG: c-type cytochrome [Candidatus Sulfotelmatobacter sp.]